MELILFISLVFSPFASAMAFIITYEEYKKHLKQKVALRHAVQMAIFAFFVFVIIGTAAGMLFSKIFQLSNNL